MDASLPFTMADIESEDSFVDVCQHDVTLVENVVTELKAYIKSAKVPKPFGTIKAWMKAYLNEFEWNTQSYDVLLHWAVALILFVEGFQPPPFTYADNQSMLVPGLVLEVLLPKALKKSNEPLLLEGQPISAQGEEAKKSIMAANVSNDNKSAEKADDTPQPSSSKATPNPMPDIMMSMFAQLQEQSAVNAQILQALQDLKLEKQDTSSSSKPAQSQGASGKEKVPKSSSPPSIVPNSQDNINHEILKHLQELHHDSPKPTFEVLGRDELEQIIKLHECSTMSYTTKAAVEAANSLLSMYQQGLALGPTDPMGPIAHSLSTAIQTALIGAAYPPSQKPQIREKQCLLQQVCGNILPTAEYKNAYTYGANERGRGRGGRRGRGRGGGGGGGGRGGQGGRGRWNDQQGWNDKQGKWKDKSQYRDQGTGPN